MQSGPHIREVAALFIGPMRRHVRVPRLAGGDTVVIGAEEAVRLIRHDNVEAQKEVGVRVLARIQWLNCPLGFKPPDPFKSED